MGRKRYLITYDISDDKRRTQVFNLLLDQGDRMQYSVFMCDLNPRELTSVKCEIDIMIHHSEDQVLFVDMGSASNDMSQRLACIGKAFSPASRVQVI